jgi:hypothetical protein
VTIFVNIARNITAADGDIQSMVRLAKVNSAAAAATRRRTRRELAGDVTRVSINLSNGAGGQEGDGKGGELELHLDSKRGNKY